MNIIKAIITRFIQLKDTPNSYSGQANKMVTVKSDETGLEFINQPTSFISSTSNTISANQIQRAALTGDVTASANSNATTIANNAVTNAKAADMAANTFKGRLTSLGDPQDLTVAQMQTALGITQTNIVSQTYAQISTAISANSLIIGNFYRITDRENIIVEAISTNMVKTICIERRIVRDRFYNDPEPGIDKSVLKISTTYNVNDRIIWWGRMYIKINNGTQTSLATYGTAIWNNPNLGMGVSGLVLQATTNDTYYETKYLECSYDFVPDILISISDWKGNTLISGLPYGNTKSQQIINSDWGNNNIYGNRISGCIINNSTIIYNNISNSSIIFNSVNGIYNNIITDNNGIQYNILVNNIFNNICKGIFNNSNTGNINDNSINNSIFSNSNNGNIQNNTNNGSINNNINITGSDNNIEFNSNNGSISSNSLRSKICNNSNNGNIISNSNMSSSININTVSVMVQIACNSNNGAIMNNSNTSSIASNSNAGEIYNNTNIGLIHLNSNLGDISSNSNTGQIIRNINTGPIGGNTNLGEISNNNNKSSITNNSHRGRIYFNGNNDYIINCTSNQTTGTNNIQYNYNNGLIQVTFNAVNIHIQNNTNNGSILGTKTVTISDITVNK